MLRHIHATLLVQVVFNRSTCSYWLFGNGFGRGRFGVSPHVLIRGYNVVKMRHCMRHRQHAVVVVIMTTSRRSLVTLVIVNLAASLVGILGCTLSCEAREQEWLADCACTVDSVDCVAKKKCLDQRRGASRKPVAKIYALMHATSAAPFESLSPIEIISFANKEFPQSIWNSLITL